MNIKHYTGTGLSEEQVKQLRRLDYFLSKDQFNKYNKQVGRNTKFKSMKDYNSKYDLNRFNSDGVLCTVIEDDGKFKGYVESEFSPRKNINHIVSVYLDPALRGKGLGRKMLKKSLDHMHKNNPGSIDQLTVLSNNIAAKTLYNSLGFTLPVSETLVRKEE